MHTACPAPIALMLLTRPILRLCLIIALLFASPARSALAGFAAAECDAIDSDVLILVDETGEGVQMSDAPAESAEPTAEGDEACFDDHGLGRDRATVTLSIPRECASPQRTLGQATPPPNNT